MRPASKTRRAKGHRFRPITTDSIQRRVASLMASSSTMVSLCGNLSGQLLFVRLSRESSPPSPGVPPMSATHEADVVVIGGGPAGSTVSTLLAQHGLRVKLFERERFPRFHIGESLIPETYWVFRRLNMLDKMKASPF